MEILCKDTENYWNVQILRGEFDKVNEFYYLREAFALRRRQKRSRLIIGTKEESKRNIPLLYGERGGMGSRQDWRIEVVWVLTKQYRGRDQCRAGGTG